LIASNVFDFIVDCLAIRCDLIGARAVFDIVFKGRPILPQGLVTVMQIDALIVNILAIAANVPSIMPDIPPVVMNIRTLRKRRRCGHPQARGKQNSYPQVTESSHLNSPFLILFLRLFRSIPVGLRTSAKRLHTPLEIAGFQLFLSGAEAKRPIEERSFDTNSSLYSG
jgi:hypothetical protein